MNVLNSPKLIQDLYQKVYENFIVPNVTDNFIHTRIGYSDTALILCLTSDMRIALAKHKKHIFRHDLFGPREDHLQFYSKKTPESVQYSLNESTADEYFSLLRHEVNHSLPIFPHYKIYSGMIYVQYNIYLEDPDHSTNRKHSRLYDLINDYCEREIDMLSLYYFFDAQSLAKITTELSYKEYLKQIEISALKNL